MNPMVPNNEMPVLTACPRQDTNDAAPAGGRNAGSPSSC